MINLIKKKTGFIILLIVLTFYLITQLSGDVYGVNRTVNWVWDITNVSFLITWVMWPIIIMGYLILLILKTETSLTLSSIQIVILILMLGGLKLGLINLKSIYWGNLISGIIFFLNLIISFTTNRNVKTKTRT